MRKFQRTSLGVTLLEVMLVLAIAAMIIVMSVRYYQSASSGQQANAVMQQIQAITAAADGLAQGTGSYATINASKIRPLIGGGTNALNTPWGTTITITGGSASSYQVTIPGTPASVCPLVTSKLATNNRYTSVTACSATGVTNLNYTYLSNPTT